MWAWPSWLPLTSPTLPNGALMLRTQSPNDAYFVKHGMGTTTQNDIDAGLVNILVGFAPLRPAEFVILEIQQKAGQIQI